MKIALLTLAAILAKPVISKQEDLKPPFSLRINSQIYLTDKNGVANPTAIINTKTGENIVIYLPTGECFSGWVKSTSMENNTIFKIFGEFSEPKNSGFGFILIKDGTFGGAIVLRDSNINYGLKYSEAANGYVFMRVLEKPNIQ